MDLLAITGGSILDGNGGPPIEDGVILIEDKRIVSVGGQSTAIPPQARRISAAGKYVIPGLMDANVHLVQDTNPLTLVRYEGRYDELVIEATQVALKSGLTTVFDTCGPRAYLIKARNDINQGRAIGSRMYIAGNIVGLGGPFSDDFFPTGRAALFEGFADRIDAIWQENVGPELVWMSPDQVRKEIRTYIQKDIDFLKYAVTTHRSPSAHLMFSERVQKAIVDEAHRAGLTAQTHSTTNEGLYSAIQAGVDLMQHVELTHGPQPIPTETIALIAERRIPATLFAQTNKALAKFREFGQKTEFFKLYDAAMDVNVRALIRSGAVLLLATDAGVFDANTLNSASYRSSIAPEESLLIMGEGHFNWLLAVEQKGMKPMEALMAATRNIARAYKVDEDLGTLEKGKMADLLILDKNPLQSAANYRSISVVMKEGQVIDRDALPTRRLLTAQTESRAAG